MVSARPSAIAPVPSVLPSSTTRISGATSSRFPASLNAITTTVKAGDEAGSALTTDGGRSTTTRAVPVPGDRSLQPFLEVDRRLEAQKPPRLVDIGDAQLHVRERPVHEGEARGRTA